MSEYFANEHNAPAEVMSILEKASRNRTKLRLWYGNKETGKDWGDVHDVFGYIGRSCGTVKIPLMIARRNSSGGPAILTDAIIKITEDKKTVYQHPKFHQPEYTIKPASKSLKQSGYNYSVFAGEQNIRNTQTLVQAEHEVAFHKGERNIF